MGTDLLESLPGVVGDRFAAGRQNLKVMETRVRPRVSPPDLHPSDHWWSVLFRGDSRNRVQGNFEPSVAKAPKYGTFREDNDPLDSG